MATRTEIDTFGPIDVDTTHYLLGCTDPAFYRELQDRHREDAAVSHSFAPSAS
jgi:hypothetical protein